MHKNINWLFFDVGSTLIDEQFAYKHRMEDIAKAANTTYNNVYGTAMEFYRKSKKEEKAVELFVNSLDCLSVEESDWQKIGQLISHFKKNGLSVPFQDAVLAYLSIKYGCKILTLDKHFPMMKVLDDRIGLWEV